jgi:hypothetical protein
MSEKHPIWRFLLCALAIWPVPHQLAEHFYHMRTSSTVVNTEFSEGDEACAAFDCEA